MFIKLLCVLAVLLSAAAEVRVAETFTTNPFKTGKWHKSGHEKYTEQPVEVMASISSPGAFSDDLGVQLTQEMRHYGFGTSFPAISFADEKEIVIQYEVKFDEPLHCGGAYVKILRDDADIASLDNATPYGIMFGPDKCGNTDKVHFILQHKSPVTGIWEEKHFTDAVPVKSDFHHTHLYSLKLSLTNEFSIWIDDKQVAEGNLLTSMSPPINPSKEIDDPTDRKPADWVDEETIPDALAVKPEDWDESAPKKIPDPTAVKPADWLDNEPLEVPNPEAIKPEDWDDEEDGLWEAPTVPNPACEAHGCGAWVPPTILNPAYKGKWVRPRIPNPAYIGQWKARQIPNPDYFYDPSPLLSVPLKGLAVEVWTTSAGIHFDNFLIASADAKEVAEFNKLYHLKHAAEKAKAKADKEAQEAEQNSITNQFNQHLLEAVHYLTANPIAFAASVAAVLGSLLVLCCWPKKAKKAAVVVEEEEDEEPKAVAVEEKKDE